MLPPVLFDVIIGVDRQVLVRIHRDQHLADVCLLRKSYRYNLLRNYGKNTHVDEVLLEPFAKIIDKGFFTFVVFQQNEIL